MIYGFGRSAVYRVEPGQKAIKFNKWYGVQDTIYKEGWHLKMPWFEKAIIYNVKSVPTKIESQTGSRDLQTVRVALRVLYRPD